MLFAVSYKFKQEALRKRLFLDKLDKNMTKSNQAVKHAILRQVLVLIKKQTFIINHRYFVRL